jgi:hypothetical protein
MRRDFVGRHALHSIDPAFRAYFGDLPVLFRLFQRPSRALTAMGIDLFLDPRK